MAAPDFIPTNPSQRVRTYTSPPARAGAGRGGRPGEIDGPQPSGRALGTAGPDQGYAFTLVPLFDDRLHLGGVKRDDAIAGCVAVAMKRAALFGRAPVVHDLTAAFTIFGFLDSDPDPELAHGREDLFAEVQSNHHYSERRHVVDVVKEEVLRSSVSQIELLYFENWKRLFTVGEPDHS